MNILNLGVENASKLVFSAIEKKRWLKKMQKLINQLQTKCLELLLAMAI
jgi:hypothetical protein